MRIRFFRSSGLLGQLLRITASWIICRHVPRIRTYFTRSTVLLFCGADAQGDETANRDRALSRADARDCDSARRSAPRRAFASPVSQGFSQLGARARAQGRGGNLRMAFHRGARAVAIRSYRAPSDRERPGRAGASGNRDALSSRHQHERRGRGRRPALLDAALPGGARRRRVGDGLSHSFRSARHAGGEARCDDGMDEPRVRRRYRSGGRRSSARQTHSEKLFVAGFSRGASFAYLFAAMHPQHVAGLAILDGFIPRRARSRDARRGASPTTSADAI